MTGARPCVYARSRHGSDDFDRGSRQQRVLTSLREQADVANLIPRMPELLAALKRPSGPTSRRTSSPSWPASPAAIDTKNIRSYVFAYPRYGTQVLAPIYKYLPNVDRIRAAVANAFKVDPRPRGHARRASAHENGSIWVLNGDGAAGRGVRASRAISSTTG